jgi:hypothetical protein
MSFTNFSEDIDDILNILDEAAITNDNIDGLDFAEFMYGGEPAETMKEGFDWDDFMSTLPPSDPMGPSFVNTHFEQPIHQPFLEGFDFNLPLFDGTVGQLDLSLSARKPTDGMEGQVEGWADGLFEELHFSQLVPTATLNSVSVTIGKAEEVILPSPHINPFDEVKECMYKGRKLKAYKANKTILKHAQTVLKRFRTSGPERHIIEKLAMKNEEKPFHIYGVGEALKGLGKGSTNGFVAKREKFIKDHSRI